MYVYIYTYTHVYTLYIYIYKYMCLYSVLELALPQLLGVGSMAPAGLNCTSYELPPLEQANSDGQTHLWLYMGGCQNEGPFLGPEYDTAPSI